MYVAIIRYGFIYFMFRTTELNICTYSVQYGVLNFCNYILLWDRVVIPRIFFRLGVTYICIVCM